MNREEQIRQWRKNIPPNYKEAYRKKFDKAIRKESMRAAVDTKCLDCMCWQPAEVKRCSVVTCPLYAYRPYQTVNSTAETPEDGRNRAQHYDEKASEPAHLRPASSSSINIKSRSA